MSLHIPLPPVQALRLIPCSPPAADGVVAHAVLRTPEGSGAGTSTRTVALKLCWVVHVAFTRGPRAGEADEFFFTKKRDAMPIYRTFRDHSPRVSPGCTATLREFVGYRSHAGWVEVLKP